MDVEIVHEPARGRFVVLVDGRESQLVYLKLDDAVVDFRSTFVHPALRGRGIGDKLIRHALDWARAEGLKVVPTCWFVDTVVRRHPEYASIIER
jgi:predicted GNAT family acetyltransferase